MQAMVIEANEGVDIDPDRELEWVRAARAGDLQAFNSLVLAHQDSLFRWVYHLVGVETLAEDLTQSVFLTAYEKLSTFRGGSFRSWLFRIARNRSIDELRRQKRHPAVSLNSPTAEDSDQEWLENLQTETFLPEAEVEQRDQAEAVWRLLDGLPEDHRNILELVDMQGLDYQAAAQVLGLPVGTVKSRLARGRVNFRELSLRKGLAGAF